jgi:hypothetical protein
MVTIRSTCGGVYLLQVLDGAFLNPHFTLVSDHDNFTAMAQGGTANMPNVLPDEEDLSSALLMPIQAYTLKPSRF